MSGSMTQEDIRLAEEWYRNDMRNNPMAESISADRLELFIKVLAENDYVSYRLAQYDNGNKNVTIDDYRKHCREEHK